VRRYWLLVISLVGVTIVVFVLVDHMHVNILVMAELWLTPDSKVAAAFVTVGMLVGDAILPVPSSILMTLNGRLFGVTGGAALSLVGALGGALAGFAIGRAGDAHVRRFVGAGEYGRAAAVLDRWGMLAVCATRPIPVLAETVAILAGASPLGWLKMTIASVAGAVPATVVYAVTGAGRIGSLGEAFVFGGVAFCAGALWFFGRFGTGRARESGRGTDLFRRG
jgi:uncharacterized membrane protein YdjX (TVP38/TMEM64 family)